MSTSPKADTLHGPFREIPLTACGARAALARVHRGARLPDFLGLEGSADSRLDAFRVMVIGSGSVGGNGVLSLARLQVGEIWIVDPGRLKAESLLTHPIAPEAIGELKVDHFGGLAKAISPTTRVPVYAAAVQSLPLAAFDRVDAVLLATDNLAAEVEVGQRCIYHRKPLVQASVHGGTLVAQVRTWLNRDGSGPCPACAFGASEWDHVNRESRFTCVGPDGRPDRRDSVVPTMSVDFLCSLAADLATMRIFRHALRLGAPLEDSVVEYCGYNHQSHVVPLVKNPTCPCEHIALERVEIRRPLGQCNLRELAGAAGFHGGRLPPDLSFLVDELTFVEAAMCCGQAQPIGRFCNDGEPLARCSHCGSALGAQPFFSHRPVPAAVLSARLEEPLERVGAGGAKSVVVRCGGRSVFCHEED